MQICQEQWSLYVLFKRVYQYGLLLKVGVSVGGILEVGVTNWVIYPIIILDWTRPIVSSSYKTCTNMFYLYDVITVMYNSMLYILPQNFKIQFLLIIRVIIVRLGQKIPSPLMWLKKSKLEIFHKF